MTVFLPIDVVFGLLVPFVYVTGLNLPLQTSTLGLTAACMALRVVISTAWMRHLLQPLELWVAMPAPMRDEQSLRAADAAVQETPSRFSVGYVLLWCTTLSGPSFLFLSGVVDGVQLPTHALGFVAFVAGAVVLGASAFSLPLMRLLLAPWGSDTDTAACERGIHLSRRHRSVRGRIAMLAVCLAVAPVLWLMGVGYMAEFRGQQETARAVAESALWRVSAGEKAPAIAAVFRPDDDDERFHALPADVQRRVRAADAQPQTATLVASNEALAFRRLASGQVIAAIVDINHVPGPGFTLGALWFILLVAVWAPLAAYFVSDSVSRPVAALTRIAGDLIDRGILSELPHAPVPFRDEVGDLAYRFNSLLVLLRRVSAAAQNIASGDLTVKIEGKGDLPEAFGGMVWNLEATVSQINATSLQLASAAAEIYAASQEQEAATATQSAAMEEISHTMESLAAAAAHVAESVKNVLGNAERTFETTDQMVARIGQLNTHTNRIGEILEVIRDISDRSDLLALNGSLEATRAGEAGSGFAVVASEMRRLAERVTTSVTDIKGLVGDIRASGASTVMATEESKKLAAETNDAARQITRVVQQQLSGTEQASQSVKEIAQVISQTAAATSQTRSSAETLKHQADLLAQLVSQYRVAEKHVG